MFSIGEFSRITGLTVKTLRFYHEQGVLIPSRVDGASGYRYYAENKIETARAISRLRELEFPLSEIAEILLQHDDDGDILEFLDRQKDLMQKKMRNYQTIARSLDQIIQSERKVRATMKSDSFDVEEKTVEPMLIASVRMKGRYSECGRGFKAIGRNFGRFICGKPMLLHHSEEYRDDDAEFEACMPVRRGSDKDGIVVKQLPGGRCLSLMHKGPYEELGRSYEKMLTWIRRHNHEFAMPTREVYHKGPGMIFRGNPARYLTEIQFMLKD